MPTPTNPTDRDRFWDVMQQIVADVRAEHPDPRDATITHLATLLDGVLADDPQAIRDAASWLTVNRPADTGSDSVDEGER